MKNHYLLWATGEDKPGIVAAVTKQLFKNGFNLEDSAMMRLGSEFAIFLIFSSLKLINTSNNRVVFGDIQRKFKLNVGYKPLTNRQSTFKPLQRNLLLVTVHGVDRPGIVYQVTQCLAHHKFNISDLSTHRTTQGKKAGYILFIEGELPSHVKVLSLRKKLLKIEKNLKTKIQLKPISSQSI